MKTKLKITLLIFVLIELNQISAQTPITIYTPRSSSVTAHTRPEYMDDDDKSDLSADMATYYPQATELNPPSATTTYNCHSYAWNMSEGGPTCEVAYFYGATNESIYWTDYSYTETTEPYASKISYTSDDHSAIQTSTQGTYISKWGDWPLMQHARDYGPYDESSRKYYRLWPDINGTFTALCENQERTFTSNTSIQGSTYSWTRDNNFLDYVSGSGTTSYRVKSKSGAGEAYLQLQITTPSGEVATTGYKYVWVGVPILNVTGPEEGYTYNNYTFYANAGTYSDPSSYTWILSPLLGNHVYNHGYYADIAFYDPDYYQVVAQATNICGTSEYSVWEISIDDYRKGFSLSPNPASESVTITVNKTVPKDDRAIDVTNDNDINTIYTLRIFDFYGVLHYSTTRSGKNFTFPVNNLKNGSYIVQINYGKNTSKLHLIVNH